MNSKQRRRAMRKLLPEAKRAYAAARMTNNLTPAGRYMSEALVATLSNPHQPTRTRVHAAKLLILDLKEDFYI